MKQIIIYMALKYMSSFIGTRYNWGGDNPLEGYDCSGFAMEYLKALGTCKDDEDHSAASIYNILKSNKKAIESPKFGCLVFYHRDNGSIYHVEIYAGLGYTLGASNGGRHINTESEARAADAYVKLRRLGDWKYENIKFAMPI